jgi:hypothetical protein
MVQRKAAITLFQKKIVVVSAMLHTLLSQAIMFPSSYGVVNDFASASSSAASGDSGGLP